ncbi:MAG: hypothetical protein ACTSRA_22705, partial [Promethearchaeota archaeon]
MEKPTILILEFTMAGGFKHDLEKIEDILIEGMAMLDALVRDALIGGFDPHIILMADLRHRLPIMDYPVNWHFVSRDEDPLDVASNLASSLDYLILVAPEFDDHLNRYAGFLSGCGARFLCPDQKSIFLVSNKYFCMNLIRSRGVTTPATCWLHDFLNQEPFSYPVVIKPNKGAGCFGVYKLSGPEMLGPILDLEMSLGF